MEESVVGTLIKLSNRSDFKELHKKYYYRKEIKIFREHISDTDSYTIWQDFHNHNEKSSLYLYESMITIKLNNIVRVISPYDQIINSNNIKTTIRNYLLENVAVLSNSLFKSEIKNYNDDYLMLLANNYDEFKNVTKKYPYWYSLVEMVLNDTERFLKEFFHQLIKDRVYVTEKFFRESTSIDDIVLSKGDRHRGRFVIEVKTPKGAFFYKPRKADVDEAFKDCLEKLSEKDEILSMETPDFVSGNTYSWFKKVTYGSLSNIEEKQRYYRRLGQLIAVIYILNGNDIHHENLISSGEYPVIVDIETLLTSRLLYMKNSMPTYMRQNENYYMLDSVRNSMILPCILKYKDQHIDISPFKIANQGEAIDVEKNKIHGVDNSKINIITDEVCKGFSAVYHEVASKKEEYKKYLDERFRQVKVRFLNKPTSEYSNLHKLLINPVCLFDFNYAFAVSARLYSSDNEEIQREELFEQEELLKFNIPYFEVKADSKNLILSDGNYINDYFSESPLDGLYTKLELLGDMDFKRQIAIIEKSFNVISPNFNIRELMDVKKEVPNPNVIVSNEAINEFTDEVIRKVFKQSLIHPLTGSYFWMDPMLEGDNEIGEKHYQINDIPNSYYAGSVGILIALLSLHNSKNYQNYIDKLIADIEMDIDKIFKYNHGEINIGAYNGLAAYVRYYMALNRNKLINQSKFEKRVTKLLNQIEISLDHDHKLDVLDGTAGVALVLVELQQIAINPRMLIKIVELMKKCRQHLLESMACQDGKSYFPLEYGTNHYYSGFAHGSSGIIMSLHKMSKQMKINDNDVLKNLLATERELYDPIQHIWYRDNKKADYSWGWCHGSPGILLSRLEMYNDGYHDSYIMDEIKILYEATMQKALGSNFTFCHGDLSNIVICKYAQDLLNFKDSRLNDYAASTLPYILTSIKYQVRGTEAVGLMSGLMGIAMFLDNVVIKNDETELRRILKVT